MNRAFFDGTRHDLQRFAVENRRHFQKIAQRMQHFHLVAELLARRHHAHAAVFGVNVVQRDPRRQLHGFGFQNRPTAENPGATYWCRLFALV